MGFTERTFFLQQFLYFFEGHNDDVNKNNPVIVKPYISV